MAQKTLTQSAQDMLDAVKALSTTQGIDWTDPAYAPVSLAHANLHDAVSRNSQRPHIGWLARRKDGHYALMTDVEIDAAGDQWTREFKLFAD